MLPGIDGASGSVVAGEPAAGGGGTDPSASCGSVKVCILVVAGLSDGGGTAGIGAVTDGVAAGGGRAVGTSVTSVSASCVGSVSSTFMESVRFICGNDDGIDAPVDPAAESGPGATGAPGVTSVALRSRRSGSSGRGAGGSLPSSGWLSRRMSSIAASSGWPFVTDASGVPRRRRSLARRATARGPDGSSTDARPGTDEGPSSSSSSGPASGGGPACEPFSITRATSSGESVEAGISFSSGRARGASTGGRSESSGETAAAPYGAVRRGRFAAGRGAGVGRGRSPGRGATARGNTFPVFASSVSSSGGGIEVCATFGSCRTSASDVPRRAAPSSAETIARSVETTSSAVSARLSARGSSARLMMSRSPRSRSGRSVSMETMRGSASSRSTSISGSAPRMNARRFVSISQSTMAPA